jgi:hypothetical protein
LGYSHSAPQLSSNGREGEREHIVTVIDKKRIKKKEGEKYIPARQDR